MPTPTQHAPPTGPQSWRGAVQLIAGFGLFWAFAAGLLYLTVPGLETFPRLLVFHEFGGTAIVVCALLMRRARWVPRAKPMMRWLLTGVIAIPVGYVIGHVIAFAVLGEPLRFMSEGHDRRIPITFIIVIGGAGLFFFATREQLAIEASVRAEAQNLAMESQLRMLRAQLEPHMLFNTLANLRSLLSEDPKQAEVMIDRLIIYLRSALAASRTEAITLGQEFTQIRAYLGIMSIRIGPRMSYRIDLPPELERVSVPPMLLQPLVENAIRHGIEPKVGQGHIDVVATRTADGIEVTVTDSGLGLPPEEHASTHQPNATGSYGLLHVHQRLEVIYGGRASVALSRRSAGGVCAVVKLPV